MQFVRSSSFKVLNPCPFRAQTEDLLIEEEDYADKQFIPLETVPNICTLREIAW